MHQCFLKSNKTGTFLNPIYSLHRSLESLHVMLIKAQSGYTIYNLYSLYSISIPCLFTMKTNKCVRHVFLCVYTTLAITDKIYL